MDQIFLPVIQSEANLFVSLFVIVPAIGIRATQFRPVSDPGSVPSQVHPDCTGLAFIPFEADHQPLVIGRRGPPLRVPSSAERKSSPAGAAAPAWCRAKQECGPGRSATAGSAKPSVTTRNRG